MKHLRLVKTSQIEGEPKEKTKDRDTMLYMAMVVSSKDMDEAWRKFAYARTRMTPVEKDIFVRMVCDKMTPDELMKASEFMSAERRQMIDDCF